MNKSKLREFIKKYKDTENIVKILRDVYGVDITNLNTDSKQNIYNNYNLLIRMLLTMFFNDLKADLLEEYVFDQLDISFDELCKILEIYETNTR